MPEAAWHPDPTGRHELRYWDGNQWTEHVADQGVQSTSPVVMEPAADQGAAGSAGAHQGVSDVATQLAPQSAQDPYASDQSAPEPAHVEPAHESAQAEAAQGEAGHEEVAPAEAAQDEAAPFDSAPSDSAQSESAPFDSAPVEPVQAQPMQSEPAQAQPMPSQPMPAQPMPGQAMGQPAMGQAQMGQAPMGQAPMGQAGPQAYGDAFAGISGDLIDGRFSEIEGAGAQVQNHKMLRVRLTEPFMAKQGSMVAYQGNVNFAYQGSGAAKFLKKALSGEGMSLMRVEGQGDVFLADTADDVHVLHLNNSGLSVSGKNILAFSASLDWNVERVKGGSMAAGGLFNTTLRGSGWVAITTQGAPVVLNAQEAPTFADAQALVAWSVHLQTSIRSTMSAGALIGRGSGEAFQVAFSGPGFVIVQPSEGYPVAAAH